MLSIVVPRAVSWVSRSIVTMEDPSLDEAAMVSGELSTLFLQLLVSLSDFKVKSLKIADIIRTSLVVQWLTLHTPNAGGPCSISGQGTRSHMLQVRIHVPQ